MPSFLLPSNCLQSYTPRLSLSFRLLLVWVAAFSTLAGTGLLAQSNPLVNEGSTPIAGVGHNYIYGIGETVMPANGSVNLKIDLPTPKGRGLAFPFAITYNSGSVHRFSSFWTGCGSLDSGVCSANPAYTDRANASGGWTDTLPYATALGLGILGYTPLNSDGDGSGAEYGCNVSTSYNFYDVNGSAHPLGLAAISNSYWSGGSDCMNIHNGSYGYNSSASGGDDEITATAEAKCDGSPTQNLDCGVGPSFVVTDLNGTKYNFPKGQVSGANVIQGSFSRIDPIGSTLTPSYMEDRNGNILRFTPSNGMWAGQGYGGLPITDTMGRQLVSAAYSSGPIVGTYPSLGSLAGYPLGGGGGVVGGGPLTYTIGGLPYAVTFTTTTASYKAQSLKVGTEYSGNCSPNFSVNDTPFIVVQSLTGPNGSGYTFKYDAQYGLVNEVDYPGGGWVKYIWKLSDNFSELVNFSGSIASSLSGPVPSGGTCVFEYQTPVVAERTTGNSADQNKIALKQTFTYNTAWASDGTWNSKTTTVLTTDYVSGQNFTTVYSYGAVGRPVQPNEGGQMAVELPVETRVQTLVPGMPVAAKTVTKTWADQFEMTSQQTQVAGGPPFTEVFCYENGDDRVWETDEFDFGKATPSLTPPPGFGVAFSPACGSPGASRKTLTGYSFTTPCITAVYDGNGNRVAETDAYIDGGTTPCWWGGVPVGNAAPNLIAGTHDEANYGPSAPAQRGNPTKIVKWSSTGGSITTTATYDETGQLLTSIDACGNAPCADMSGGNHTTTYSYADSFTGGNPSGNSNAYVTGITNALGQTQHFTYNYPTGQLASATDANGQTTRYGYADPLNRLTYTGLPDGGSTTINYNDAAPSPSVTTTTAASPDPSVVSTSVMDGMGHVVQTQLNSDPLGTDYVDTGYNGMGQVQSVSNPYRGGGAGPNATTFFAYDALGRKVTQTQPDGSTLKWCYNGMATSGIANCPGSASSFPSTMVEWADSYDEAGSHRQHVSDALGRLIAVMETDANNNLAAETDYGYDALNNLTAVNQHAGKSGSFTLSRTFSYDSLSRLITATNPETGTICYGQWNGSNCQPGYDANGNLGSKTDANNTVTSYNYDALNRLTLESAPSTAPGVHSVHNVFAYDAEVQGSPIPTAPNSIGRLVWASNWIETDRHYQYDSMGRPILMQGSSSHNRSATGSPVSVNYDLMGNKRSISYPSGRVIQRSFDGAGRLYGVQDVTSGSSGPNYLNITSFWPDGQVNKKTLGSALSERMEVNNRMQPFYVVANSTALPPADPHGNVYDKTLMYASPNNGNITSIVDNMVVSRTQGFTYDGLNRLATAMRNDGAYNHTYRYDSFGNMLLQDNLQATPNYSIDAGTNRLLLNGNNLQYNAAGQLTGDPFHTYGYDASAMLAAIDNGSTASYSYNQGNRTTKYSGAGATDYIYLDGQPLAEQDGSGAWTDYVYDGNQKIAKVVTQSSSLNLHGIRDSSINMNCGTEGPVSGTASVAGYTIQSGDRLMMSVKQTLPTYGGLAFIFTSGDGTGSLTDIATGTPFYFNGVADGAWHTMVGDLSPFAGKKVSYVLAGIHSSAPSGTFDLNMKDAVLQTAGGSTISILNGQAAGVGGFSGWTCGGHDLSSGAVLSPVTYPDNTTFFVNDQINSTQVEVTATGLPIFQGQYTPFGQEIIAGSTSNTFGYQPDGASSHYKFSGKERDAESGFDYFGARYYGSNMGRWLSPDWSAKAEPVPYAKLDNPQSLNLYTYVGNNPLSKADADGHCWPLCLAPVGGGVLGGLVTAGEAVGAGVSTAFASGVAALGVGLAALSSPADQAYFAAGGGFNTAGAPMTVMQQSSGSATVPVPTGLVGTDPIPTKGRTNSGPLAPEHGGSGDAGKDFGTLTGGKNGPAPEGKGYPAGTRIGTNDTQFRPGSGTSGPRIDVPANGSKPIETLHYPPPPPPRPTPVKPEGE